MPQAEVRTAAQGFAADALTMDVLDDLGRTPDYAGAVRRLLAVVRTQLGMQVAWVSEFVGNEQVLRYVDAAPEVRAPAEGSRSPLSGSFCVRVLDGRFPSVIPDSRAAPEASLLTVTAELHIGSYVGVPLTDADGAVTGMLCAVHENAAPHLDERDVAALRLMAELLRDLQRRAVSAAEAQDLRARLRRTLERVIAGSGRFPVLQPVVDLVTGRPVLAEGLTRFAGDLPVRAPAQWFDDAARLDLRVELELAAAGSVLDLLPGLPERVAVTVNLAPQTLLSPGMADLLRDRALEHVVVEVTEHAVIEDYDALEAALRPYRARGLRLAVDDAGAGYASLRHVLSLRPDFVKVDMALTRGADRDLARRTLLSALVDFAEALDCRLVAEGIETEDELRAMAGCGVHLVQGYLLAAPSPTPRWSGYPMP